MKLPKIPKVEMFGIDIVKNFLLFVLFFVIFITLLVILVAPTIKKFKEIKAQYYKTKIELQKTEDKLNKNTAQYRQLYKNNKKIILAYKTDFNKAQFIDFAKKYMKIIKIKKIDETIYKNNFIKTSYLVTAILNSPTGFYKLVENLKYYNLVLKVYFPIVFKAKNNKIKIIYKIEHFKELIKYKK